MLLALVPLALAAAAPAGAGPMSAEVRVPRREDGLVARSRRRRGVGRGVRP